MGTRVIDSGADYKAQGKGWFGIGQYLPITGLEAFYALGTNYPDNRMRDQWDYAANDRFLKPRQGGAIDTVALSGGYYETPLAPAALGKALTIFALVKRPVGKNGGTDYSYFGDFQSPNSLLLFSVNGTPTRYGFGIGNGSGANTTIFLPLTDSSGAKWELIVGVIPGDGSARIHVKRLGEDIATATMTGFTAGQIYSTRALRIGQSYDGFAPSQDPVAMVGAYSRALSADEIETGLYAGLARFCVDWGGPAL